MAMQLEGKVALITGAARGMGAEAAKLLGAEGASVMLTDVRDDDGRDLAARLARAAYQRLDVANEDDWATAIAATCERFGRLDVLVNNAGIYHTAPIEETSLDMFLAHFRVNQLGTFLGMRAALPAMKERGGSIINMSSISGFTGNAFAIAYGSTKWAVRGMTKVAAIEFGAYNIRVNSVHPGLIDTPMNQEEMGAEIIAKSGSSIPLRRVGVARDVANLILFLASDASAYCTGAEFVCDGGTSAGRMRKPFPPRQSAVRSS